MLGAGRGGEGGQEETRDLGASQICANVGDLVGKTYYSWTAVPAPGKVNGVNL